MQILKVTKDGSRKGFRRRVQTDGAGSAFNWLRHEGTNYAERSSVFRRQNGSNCPRYQTVANEAGELALLWAGDMRGVVEAVTAFAERL